MSTRSFTCSSLCLTAPSLSYSHAHLLLPSVAQEFTHCLPTSLGRCPPAAAVPATFQAESQTPANLVGQPGVPQQCTERPSQSLRLLGPCRTPSSPIFHWITKFSNLQNSAHTPDCGNLPANPGPTKAQIPGLMMAARVAQWFSTAFGPGCDPGDQGSSPTSCVEPASPSACVSAPLSLPVSLMNK